MFNNDFSKEIYDQTYSFNGENIHDTLRRIAKDLASVEDDKEHWEEKFYEMLCDFKFVPGGRIISNAGLDLKGTSYINCFVHGFEGESQDSMEGILKALKAQALILKSEGGYGFCADVMRPRGGYIEGIGNESPGSVKMLDMWDTQSTVITEGSGKKSKKGKKKIRKGAQMVTMTCTHPDIEEFITAKQTQGRLTKFNMSVLVTDAFMEAVKNNQPWELIFPDFDSDKEIYNKEWDGNIKLWQEKGYPVKVYKTYENANELWDLIMNSTYKRNEPGVLFYDAINRLNNMNYVEHINATNPCFPSSEYLLTENGYEKIGDLYNKRKSDKPNFENDNTVITDNRISYKDDGTGIEKPENWKINKKAFGTSTRKASNVFLTQKDAKILELKTDFGNRIRCTPDHHIATTDGMVEAKDLTKDHKILLPTLPTNGSIVDRIPESKEEILSALMGLVIGDGYIYKENNKPNKKPSIVFGLWGDDRNRMKDYICSLIDKLYSMIGPIKGGMGRDYVNYTISDLPKRDEIRIKSTWLSCVFENNGFNLNNKTSIPEFIMKNSSSNIGKYFIAGLFYCDGSVQGNHKSGYSIRLSQSNEELLEKIQMILHSNGLMFKLYKRYDERVKLMPDGKGGKKEYLTKVNFELISTQGAFIRYKETIGLLNHPSKTNRMIIENRTFKEAKNQTTKLVSVEECENEAVYCIQEPITRSIIVNGISTRRCGEQVLPHSGNCLLGSINLTQFIDFENQDWDYNKLEKYIPVAVRLMDNVNDKTILPLDSQVEEMLNKRRIGLGIMGYGSALMMLNIRYGSEKAIQITEELMSFISNTVYQTSSNIAKEKGSFPSFIADKYLNSDFIKNLSEETKDLIREQGMRNSHLLSIQPTGNTGIFANIVSGGLEPVFMPSYKRSSIFPYPPEGLDIPKNINWSAKKYDSLTEWEFVKEGDSDLLRTEFNEYVWKYDKDRGLLRETIVKDYAVNFLEQKGLWDPAADWAVTTNELSIDEHVDTMKVLSKYIDSAMSKTINLTEDTTYEDFKDVYMKVYDSKTIKGCTTYRAGTMTEVLGSADKKKETSDPSVKFKRPIDLKCDIHQPTIKGEKWIVVVGFRDENPYEVFAFRTKNVHIPSKAKEGIMKRIKSGHYNLEVDGFVFENITEHFESTEEETRTKLVSGCLRHGMDISYIVDILNTPVGDITSFSKVIARTLKKYVKDGKKSSENCPECGHKLVFQEGCLLCVNCGFSKCG